MPNARKPDNIHKLKGTYQPCRHGDPDTKPDWNEDAPDMPDCLCKTAQAEWARVMSAVPEGVLTKSDRALLTQYCALWAELEKDPAKFSITAHGQFKLLQQELGFTPLSRGKIVGKPKKKTKGPRMIPR